MNIRIKTKKYKNKESAKLAFFADVRKELMLVSLKTIHFVENLKLEKVLLEKVIFYHSVIFASAPKTNRVI